MPSPRFARPLPVGRGLLIQNKGFKLLVLYLHLPSPYCARGDKQEALVPSEDRRSKKRSASGGEVIKFLLSSK